MNEVVILFTFEGGVVSERDSAAVDEAFVRFAVGDVGLKTAHPHSASSVGEQENGRPRDPSESERERTRPRP
jgi:hypothetical protein